MRKLKNEELGRLSPEEFREAPKIPVHVVLDNVRSAHNVGSVFRSSDAFRVEKIWLCGITATPPNRDIRKTALGATESVAWEYAESTPELIGQLQGEGFQCFAVEQATRAQELADFQPVVNTPIALILGHEVDGVAQEVVDVCDGVLEIPQHGTKHSLNVSVAAGIVLWEVSRKLSPASSKL
ncbi:SpoU rRNA Methylase family protein [Robiginitalea myxolifaciens]|uniref:SpoU rRNA Methylase family protein n=1 Tax=Robiginitalea myxolifaciens TaxID=400055 RepID=A0A1I6FSF2_9FLAO|nr:RNA methyltransferase [Robiginitalea myxolifaciens]SFR32875.1 SpoU rRNA Methylase family protein [Robiginitalea myxolifaciens]